MIIIKRNNVKMIFTRSRIVKRNMNKKKSNFYKRINEQWTLFFYYGTRYTYYKKIAYKNYTPRAVYYIYTHATKISVRLCGWSACRLFTFFFCVGCRGERVCAARESWARRYARVTINRVFSFYPKNTNVLRIVRRV